MRPSSKTVRGALAWFVLALPAAFFAPLVVVWAALGVFGFVLLVLDAVALLRRGPLEVEREAPESTAAGVWGEVALTVHNASGRVASIHVFDHPPLGADFEGLPHACDVPAAGSARFSYRMQARARGTARFGRVELLRVSPFGLWHARERAGDERELRVYPNYAPVVRYSLLALENRVSQMGIRRRPRRGSGLEFHQLRDYREGDLIQQIDWKATSRRRELISREYQEERDQNVVFLVDSGRRMRSMDGELSQFDHCLNAILLLTYIALRQGDAVGVLGFGGSERWLAPVRGAGGMTKVLNGIYDLQPTTAPSDYLEAARRTMMLQRRRALVVLLTNLRAEDAPELDPALRTLRRRHLVIVASLRERAIDRMRTSPVADLEEALNASAADLYVEGRQRVIERLRAQHVSALDVTAQQLPVALANRYFDAKGAGVL
ncbi:MAG: DUF58 domain-containing protein [bacterium]|nr:DUF58 domain-containing protein [bacterium]